MPYAEGRLVLDADAHIMEPKDWLYDYADEETRGRLTDAFAFSFDKELAATTIAARALDEQRRLEAEERLLAQNFFAYGAFDATERSRTLDLLGFGAQLVFQTFAMGQFAGHDDPAVIHGGSRALNRAIADWCSADPRLLGVGYVPMLDPRSALDIAVEAIELGCRALLLPTAFGEDHGPSHVDFDPLWDTMAHADVPFVVHVGTGGRLTPRGYRNNGKPIPPDIHGGGENIRSKDFLGIHFWPQYFLSVLALDGVFHRFPTLRGASIEQGASWVPSMLFNLDACQDAFKREPDIKALPMKASDYLRRQVKFTPFYQEDVGALTKLLGPDLLMFSSDFPHAEGGRDPIGRFDRGLVGTSEDDKYRFYAGNFRELMGTTLEELAAA